LVGEDGDVLLPERRGQQYREFGVVEGDAVLVGVGFDVDSACVDVRELLVGAVDDRVRGYGVPPSS
jgi:hypothetical protein